MSEGTHLASSPIGREAAGAAALDEHLSALLDDADFWELERAVSRFNIFDALGAVTGELRHSNLLAYLLSPTRPHGLGSALLQRVLRCVLEDIEPSERPISTLEVLVGDLDDAIVFRERDGIDLLIEIEALDLVVIIENKIRAKAGEGQLKRYRQIVEARYPDRRKIMIFLTPDGDVPDEPSYRTLSYVALAGILAEIGEGVSQPSATTLVIKHYVDMLRRSIVSDDRLQALARKLYERHSDALEFIFRNRPRPTSLLDGVAEQVKSCDGLIIDSTTPSALRFSTETWDEALSLTIDPNTWTKTGRGLLFEVKTYANKPGRVNLALVLGPGNQMYREALYGAARNLPQVFTGLVKPMGLKWTTIFSRDLLTAELASSLSHEAQVTNLGLAWSEFQAQTLPVLTEAVVQLDAEIGSGLSADNPQNQVPSEA